jgi:hypothetical protein
MPSISSAIQSKPIGSGTSRLVDANPSPLSNNAQAIYVNRIIVHKTPSRTCQPLGDKAEAPTIVPNSCAHSVDLSSWPRISTKASAYHLCESSEPRSRFVERNPRGNRFPGVPIA